MKVIVSDTSPIRALANLGLLDLLRDLYGEIVVPPAVDAELRRPRAGQHEIDLRGLAFVTIRPPLSATEVARFRTRLDAGESEALALAAELQADLILMDEIAGREAAREIGVVTVGTFGILVDAKRLGLIQAVAPLVDRLRDEFRFFVTPTVRSIVLRAAGESDGNHR